MEILCRDMILHSNHQSIFTDGLSIQLSIVFLFNPVFVPLQMGDHFVWTSRQFLAR